MEVRDPNLTYDELETGRISLLARLSDLENPATGETAEAASNAPLLGEAAADAERSLAAS